MPARTASSRPAFGNYKVEHCKGGELFWNRQENDYYF